MKAILITIITLIISLPIIVYNFFYYDVYCLYGHYFKKHEKYYFENIELCKQYMEDEELDKQILKEYEKYKKFYEQSKSDPYGGKTPRETLDLFMQALEDKDYKLAAKYYTPKQWKEGEKKMKQLLSLTYHYNKFINTYKTGIIKQTQGIADEIIIEIYEDEQDKYPYYFVFIKNPHTGLWKIKEF